MIVTGLKLEMWRVDFQVFSQSDDYQGTKMTNPIVLKKYRNDKKAQTHLGASSIIMSGVAVPDGCSVAKMSLVTKTKHLRGSYVGFPAKRIMKREQDLLKLKVEHMAE